MTADGIPVLLMRLTPGQRVTCNFQNLLPDTQIPEGTSIHWHGIELDNDSDGTAVTQDAVKNNQSYTYRFIAPPRAFFGFTPTWCRATRSGPACTASLSFRAPARPN